MYIIPHGSSVRIADVVPGYKKPKGNVLERLFEEIIATSAVLPEPYTQLRASRGYAGLVPALGLLGQA